MRSIGVGSTDMVFSGQLGAVRANQGDQLTGGDFKTVLALDADLARIGLNQAHALAILARAETQQAAHASGLSFVLREQAYVAYCARIFQLCRAAPDKYIKEEPLRLI